MSICLTFFNDFFKELVGRLEATMIQWTRQIKEVLSAQEAVETNENAGPLDEIEFWNNRCKDLSGLSKQLDLEGVKRVQKILSVAKLSYVNQFDKLSKLIQGMDFEISKIFLTSILLKIHTKTDLLRRNQI